MILKKLGHLLAATLALVTTPRAALATRPSLDLCGHHGAYCWPLIDRARRRSRRNRSSTRWRVCR